MNKKNFLLNFESKKDKLITILNLLNVDDLINVYNWYCEDISDRDSQIIVFASDYLNSCFYSAKSREEYDNLLGDYTAEELEQKNYLYIDGYGHLTPIEDLDDFIPYKEIADFILRSNKDYGIDEIRAILDEREDKERV